MVSIYFRYLIGSIEFVKAYFDKIISNGDINKILEYLGAILAITVISFTLKSIAELIYRKARR